MQYFDKHGKRIQAGMKLIMPGDRIKAVYRIEDEDGNIDLAISTSDEAYLKKHPEAKREFCSLSKIPQSDMAVGSVALEWLDELRSYAPGFAKAIPFLFWVLVPIVLSIVLFCNFRIVVTDGASMEPSYTAGNILLIRKTDQMPEVGDEVVIKLDNGSLVLKRVAYLPGDDVTKDGYEAYWAAYNDHEERIPDGYVYVLGDNLEESTDSRDRSFGIVPTEQIWGTPVFKFPFSISPKEE